MGTRTPSKNGQSTSICMKIKLWSPIASGLPSASSSIKASTNTQSPNSKRGSPRIILVSFYPLRIRRKTIFSSNSTSILWPNLSSIRFSMRSQSQGRSLTISSKSNFLPHFPKYLQESKLATRNTITRNGLWIWVQGISLRKSLRKQRTSLRNLKPFPPRQH